MKHLTIFFILSLLVCTGISEVRAQDVHFTQFYLSPLTTNPGFTGNTPGDWRLTANHRNQWNILGRPYTTTSLGFEHNFYLHNEKFSGGLLYLHDNSGVVDLKYDKVMLSIAYHKKYGKHRFHLGFQPGFVFKSVNLNGSTLPNQYDRNTGGFNPNLPSGEPGITPNINYFDFNMGLGYTFKLPMFKGEVGYTMFHVNRPTESFYGIDNELPARHTATLGLEFKTKTPFVFYPHFLYMNHQKASEMLMGMNVLFLLEDNKAKATGVYAGLIFRNGIKRNTDAAVMVVGMKFKRLEVGVNYDFNISELKSATRGRGAYEFSIVYTGASSVLNKTAVPCDRF